MRRIWVGRRIIEARAFDYYILAENLSVRGAVHAEEYGLEICGEQESAAVQSITFSTDLIRRMANLLMLGTVTPVTLREIVEDWMGSSCNLQDHSV